MKEVVLKCFYKEKELKKEQSSYFYWFKSLWVSKPKQGYKTEEEKSLKKD